MVTDDDKLLHLSITKDNWMTYSLRSRSEKPSLIILNMVKKWITAVCPVVILFLINSFFLFFGSFNS